MRLKSLSAILALFAALGLPAGCGSPMLVPTSTPTSLAEELVFYDWADDAVVDVFDEFEAEYGVNVKYVVYNSQEEALENIRSGGVYDIAVIENLFIPLLADAGLLATIDYHNVPNFKNISGDFRDLAYDPGNRHTIPYSWGCTGLLVRADLTAEPVTAWTDIWDPRHAGKVVLWTSTPRYTLGAALKSLGFSANSEEPSELEAALDRLISLKPSAIWLDDEISSSPALVAGDAVIALGWGYDVWTAREENEHITFVLPTDGAILWGDNFVIPANSPNQYTAELLLNFLLRPEISGQLISNNHYPMAHDAAAPYVDPEILNDAVIYPRNEDLKNAEILLPLSPAGAKLHTDIWERFLAAGQ